MALNGAGKLKLGKRGRCAARGGDEGKCDGGQVLHSGGEYLSFLRPKVNASPRRRFG